MIQGLAGLIPYSPVAGDVVYVGCEIRADGEQLTHVEQASGGDERRVSIPLQTVRQFSSNVTLTLTCSQFGGDSSGSVRSGFGTSLIAMKVGAVERTETPVDFSDVQ